MSIESLLENILDQLIDIKQIVSKGTNRHDRENPGNRLLTIKDWKKYHDWPTEGSWRRIIFNHDSPSKPLPFIKRVGSRVLIDEKKFYEWVEYNTKHEILNSKERLG